ncbi:hypothetical protein COE56_00910 [Bacillus anthracis]|nr:hypothetical protein COE56_00910 [Bacillus anthracis]
MGYTDKSTNETQNATQQKTTGSYYDNEPKLNPLAQIDKWTQDLSKNTGAANYKTTLGLVEKTLPTIYKDMTLGNFNNTARVLTMYGAALIPYGGVFISPIIGILWPENTTAQDSKVAKMVKDLTSLMDKKISDYDLAKLQQKTDALMIVLKKFEDSVNNKPQSESYYDSIQNANINYADILNTKFDELIKESQTKGYQLAELPIFTIIATAHLQFLRLIEASVQNPRIKMDPEHLSTYFPKAKKKAEDYRNYVNETFYGALEEFHRQTGGQLKSDEEIEAFQKIVNIGKITAHNEAFLFEASDASDGNWEKRSGKWYFIGKDKIAKTGWILLINIWYYLSPADGTKNSAGVVFNKGEMMTGWVEIKDTKTGVKYWYYFSPADGFTGIGGNTFSEGEMVTGSVYIGNKTYNFSKNGVCQNP